MTQIIQNIAELKLRKGRAGVVIEVSGYYSANDGGGGKYYWDNTSTVTDNGGSVISVTGVTTGRWIGVFTNNEVSVRRFGAKGDGVQDDLPMLNAATTFCLFSGMGRTLVLPSGVYRITDTWLIGYRAASEDDIVIYGDITQAPSYTTSGSPSVKNNLLIRGQDNTVIHGDFSSEEDLKAIVYYCIRTSGGASDSEFAPKIENIKIFGQGGYIGVTDQNLTSEQVDKNQIGFVSVLAYAVRLERVYCQNMKYGCITSNGYGSHISNYSSTYTNKGLFDIGSAASYRDTIRLFFCSTGYEISLGSGVTQIYNIWIGGDGSITGIKIQPSSTILIDGLYSELTRPEDDENATIDIGRDSSDPLFEGSLASPDRVHIRGANISARYEGSSTRSMAIRCRATSGEILISSSNIIGSVEMEEDKFTRILFHYCRVAEGTITGNKIFYFNSSLSELGRVKAEKQIEALWNISSDNIVEGKKLKLFGGGTNLLRYSTTLNGTGWTNNANMTKSLNAGVNPYGIASDATGLKVSVAGTRLNHALESSVEVGETYTFSVWVRSDSSNTVTLGIGNNGYVTHPVTSDWKIISTTYTVEEGTLDTATIAVNSISSDNVLVYGAMLNKGYQRQPYTSTTSSEITTPSNDFQTIESEGKLRLVSRSNYVELPDYIKVNNYLPLLDEPQAGIIEANSTDIYWTDDNGNRKKLNNEPFPFTQEDVLQIPPDTTSTEFEGIDTLESGTVFAAVADLNTLREAYESLRIAYEALLEKLEDTGIITISSP